MDRLRNLSSFSISFPGQCPACKKDISANVCMIIIADKDPELAERARRGILHTHPCPHCGAAAQFDAPLLYIDVAKARTVFVPPYVTNEERSRVLLNFLLSIVFEGLTDKERGYLLRKLCAVVQPTDIERALVDDPASLLNPSDKEQKARLIRLGLGGLSPSEKLERMIELYHAGEPVPLSPEEATDPFWSLIITELERARMNEIQDRIEALEGMQNILSEFRQKLGAYYEPPAIKDELLGSAIEKVQSFLRAGDLLDSRKVLEAHPAILDDTTFARSTDRILEAISKIILTD